MALTVNFYRFSKKRNSTARPTGQALASLSCVLKQPSGVVSPELYVAGADGLAGQANYAYISDFGRYYYVREWSYTEGAWTVSLSVDALATYKTQIGSSTQYVRRAQSAYNASVVDDAIPTIGTPTTRRTGFRVLRGANDWYYLGDPFPYKDVNSGWYVVGVINGDVNAVGGCSYYAFNSANFKAFKNVFTDVNSFSTQQTQQDLLRAQFNPINYIASVKWFPCEVVRDSTGVTSIPFGWWTMTGPYTCYRITGAPTVISNRGGGGRVSSGAYTTADNVTVGIPHHPQAGVVHSNVNNDKYCKYTLECHPFGIFPLPADIVANTSDLYIKISVDPVSGEGALRVTAQGINKPTVGDMQVELVSATTRIAIDIPMAQIAVDNLGVASSGLDMVAGAASSVASIWTLNAGGTIAGLADAAKAGISMTASNVPQVKAMGSMGSLAEYYMSTEPVLTAQFYLLTEEAPSKLGYPLCENRQISGLSGFIMCGNVEIDLPATEAEHDQVVSMMEGGFEYE